MDTEPRTRVDKGLISACIGPYLDFKDNLREVLRAALEEQRKAVKRDADEAAIKKDLAQAERRAREAQRLVLDSEGVERDGYRAAYRSELKRCEALKSELAKQQTSTPRSTESILDAADHRVAELLWTLAAGGIEARPAVRSVLGSERLAASRGENGWVLRGSVATVQLLDAVAPGALPPAFGSSDNEQKLTARHDEHPAFVGSDKKQKLSIKGTVIAPTAPAAPATNVPAGASPASQPAVVIAPATTPQSTQTQNGAPAPPAAASVMPASH